MQLPGSCRGVKCDGGVGGWRGGSRQGNVKAHQDLHCDYGGLVCCFDGVVGSLVLVSFMMMISFVRSSRCWCSWAVER